jgi:hypothetical protein
MDGVDIDNHYNSTQVYCFPHKSVKWWPKVFWGGGCGRQNATVIHAYYLYRLKTTDAKKIPVTHLQFRKKLVEKLYADRNTVWG